MTACVAIIPARGGSRRIYRKNIAMFHGRPIIAYSIETALATGLFDAVIVSTDCQEIADIAQIYGAVALMRDDEYAADAIGTQEVARHAIEALAGLGHIYDYACVIYATAPMMMPEDLHGGLSLLEADLDTDFVISVGDSPLQDAGQWYWGHADNFGINPLVSVNTVMVPIPKERVCDINTSDDWARAETMYRAWKGLS